MMCDHIFVEQADNIVDWLQSHREMKAFKDSKCENQWKINLTDKNLQTSFQEICWTIKQQHESIVHLIWNYFS